MADIKEITVQGVTYGVKDAAARLFMSSSGVDTTTGAITINGTSFTAASASSLSALEQRIQVLEAKVAALEALDATLTEILSARTAELDAVNSILNTTLTENS